MTDGSFVLTFGIVAASEGAAALILTLLPRLGSPGRKLSEVIARAPALDVVLAALIWIPWVPAAIVAGWRGLAGALVGQIVVMHLWIVVHELVHREAARGPRIGRVLNRRVGWWRNHLALWVTMIAVPGFWVIRILQLVVYPLLVALVRFPSYRQRDWVAVSRHKFRGLVGHDLIWCLYCDWMTGVYSLGAEMLRNVESFWCPIRFDDTKKCENCRIDFPDVDDGWVPADGTMRDVEELLRRKYDGRDHSWFGHPARLTVDGEPMGEVERS